MQNSERRKFLNTTAKLGTNSHNLHRPLFTLNDPDQMLLQTSTRLPPKSATCGRRPADGMGGVHHQS